MKKLIQFYENVPAKPPSGFENEHGSAMIYLIGVVLIMSALGAAMLNLMSTSTLGQISVNHMDRAYFMAESGFRYVFALVKDDIESDGIYDDIHGIHDRTFVLDSETTGEEGRFKIKVADDPDFVLVSIIGSIDAGVSTDVEARVTYRLGKTPEPVFSSAVFSDDDPVFDKDVYIVGDVGTNGTTIDEAGIEGDTEISAEKILESIEFLCDTCTDAETIGNDAVWGAGAYEYETLTIRQERTVTIAGEVTLYVKKDLQVEKDAVFRFLEGGSLTVYMDGKADFKEGFAVKFDPPESDIRPEDFILFGTSNADTITIEQWVTFIGAIYAPDSKIVVRKESDVTGSLVGDMISIDKDTTVTFDPEVASIVTPVDGIFGNVNLSDPVQYFSR